MRFLSSLPADTICDFLCFPKKKLKTNLTWTSTFIVSGTRALSTRTSKQLLLYWLRGLKASTFMIGKAIAIWT